MSESFGIPQDMDFNTAEKQVTFDLLPVGTIAPMTLAIRAGGAGPDGSLTQSKSSDVQFLNVEFTVTEGQFARRKIFQNLTVAGGKLDENGRSKAASITKSFLRAIIDSANGLDPEDDSPAARQKRVKNGYADFNGMTFLGKIGIEKGKDGYADKNKIVEAITKGHKAYGTPTQSAAPVVAAPAFAQTQATQAPPSGNSSLPAWAR